MAHHRARLSIEELSVRNLPSATLPIVPLTHAQQLFDSSHATILGIHANGTYRVNEIQSDAGKEYQLTGSASLGGLGQFKFTGTATALGFIPEGQAAGTIVLSSSRGTITMKLTGPPQHGFSPLPREFFFQITAGTGAFTNIHEAGILQLQVGSSLQGQFTLMMSAGTSSQISSGIRGAVTVGPISPVIHPGEPDSRPLRGAIISIKTIDGSMEITRRISDAAGMFYVALPPGDYLVVPVSSNPKGPYPRATQQTIHIDAGQTQDLSIQFDTGIR